MEDCVKNMKKIAEKLTECVNNKLAEGIEAIDTAEMGMVMDMIKDIAEAEKYTTEAGYYKTVKEAMEESELKHYTEPYYRRVQNGYNGNNDVNGTNTSNMPQNSNMERYARTMHYTEPMREMMRPQMSVDYMDERMGRAGQSRKMYMEHKESNPESTNTVDVKKYADDLSEDIRTMMGKIKMSPQEKQVLKQTLLNTANMI